MASSVHLVVPVPFRRRAWADRVALLEGWHLEEGSALVGVGESVARVQRLPMESDCFGKPMGRVDAIMWRPDDAVALARRVVAVARDLGIDHLSIRVPATAAPLIRALTGAGFQYIESMVTLKRDIVSEASDPPTTEDGVEIGPILPGEIDDLAEHTKSLYDDSRFFTDPALPMRGAQEFFARWFRNNCSGRAETVLVARLNAAPSGYVACLLDRANGYAVIDLVAVLPAARGRGLGDALMRAACAQLGDAVPVCFVGTQAGNAAALRMYQTAGFVFADVDVTMHWSAVAVEEEHEQ